VTTLILVHIPKTGGTSLCHAIRRSTVKTHRDHTPAIDLIGTYDRDFWDGAFKVAFVRNPWDRAVSLYYWWNASTLTGLDFNDWIRAGSDMRFREYAQKLKFDPFDQMKYFQDEDGQDMVNFVGQYENLDADAKVIAKRLRCDIASLPHMQVSKRPRLEGLTPVPYQQLYRPDTADMIAERCRTLIERFGYTFE